MSTDLYGVRVLEKAPEALRVRIRVFVVYYDTAGGYHEPIPYDRSFFLRAFAGFDVFGDDVTNDQWLSEAWVERNAFRFVTRFEELSTKNVPVTDYSELHDFFYERDGKWVDEDKLVQADFDVWLTKQSHVEAVPDDLSRGTTAYVTRSDTLEPDDHATCPVFSDHMTFTPFPNATQEASTANRMVFSPDGETLLVVHDDGGYALFDAAEIATREDAPALRGAASPGKMFAAFSFSPDGDLVMLENAFGPQGLVRVSPESGELQGEAPGGLLSTRDGARYVVDTAAPVLTIASSSGELFSTPRNEDVMTYASFDDEGQSLAYATEDGELHLVTLGEEPAATEIKGHKPVRELAMSADGSLIAVTDFTRVTVMARDGRVLRVKTYPRYQQMPTALCFTPDGDALLVSRTDSNGYASQIDVFPVGRVVSARENAPLSLPTTDPFRRADGTLDRAAAALALSDLYAKRTAHFGSGWSSHLSTDLLCFHLARVRLGQPSDLVDRMDPRSQTMARGYEAHLAMGAGDEARAKAARALLPEPAEEPSAAAIAVARAALGEDPSEALQHARAFMERNGEHIAGRGPMIRAMLLLGRLDEAKTVIAETASSCTREHESILIDLAYDHPHELFVFAAERFPMESAWDKEKLLERLLHAGKHVFLAERLTLANEQRARALARWWQEDRDAAESFAKQGEEESLLQHAKIIADPEECAVFGDGWLLDPKRLSAELTVALLAIGHDAGFQALAMFGEYTQHRALLGLAREIGGRGLSWSGAERLPASFRVLGLACQGAWADVSAAIEATPLVQRGALIAHASEAAIHRGDVHIALVLLPRLICEDMNSPGVRQLQAAFRVIAKDAAREWGR